MVEPKLAEITFGSVHRRGREDPDYQLDRLRRLCSFSLEVMAALSRRLQQEQHDARAVWKGNQWLLEQRGNLKRAAAEQERIIAELRAGQAALEEAKRWLQERDEHWQDTASRQEQVIREQADTIARLQEAQAWLQNSLREQADVIAKMEDAKTYFQNTIREQAETVARLEEAKDHFLKTIREQADALASSEQSRQLLQAQIAEHLSRIRALEKSSQERIEALSHELAVEKAKLAEMAAWVERLRRRWWWRAGRHVARLTGAGKTLRPPWV